MRNVRRWAAVLVLALIPTLGARDQGADDPPARVGRLSFIAGAVSFRLGGEDDWGDATLNYPLTAGDKLWADGDARAEVTLGATAVRLGPYTGIEFLTLDDATMQIRLSEGSLQIRVRTLREGEVVEIATPNGAVSLLRPGSYRVDADSLGDYSTITVRAGEAEVSAGGGSFSVRRQQSATLSGADEPTYDISTAPTPDQWDRWCAARDSRADYAVAARYVSRDMPGYEDLDGNGYWRPIDAYGPVWIPRVAPGWAPYRYGHWRWVDPWGWTWIDDAAWGFAPFHYGRWIYVRGAWGWVPGRLVAVRPVYAPALVVFVGADEGIGWFPLAPGEAYYPSYHASRTYVRNVNVTTVNVTNITVTNVDITNVHYANRTAPRGVTLVRRETFVESRRVDPDAVELPRQRLERVQVVGMAPPIAPTRESVAPRRRETVERRPPEGLFTRRVVVKREPSPAPVPFDVRQRSLQEHPGRPVDPATLHALRALTPAADGERDRTVRTTAATPGTPATLQPARRGPATPAKPEQRGEPSHPPLPLPEPRPPQAGTPPQPSAAAPQHQEGQRPDTRRQPEDKKSARDTSDENHGRRRP